MIISIELIKKLIMCLLGLLLIYLAIKKNCEPMLLLPIGFGSVLVNLPNSTIINYTQPGIGTINGPIEWLYNIGIAGSEIMPLLLFIGIGAMIDFSSLINQPGLFVIGFAAHMGIFLVAKLAILIGFNTSDALSIGIIGSADGPTSILVSQILDSNYKGSVAVAAYSYVTLVPLIQPIIIRLFTSEKERCIHMDYRSSIVSRRKRILFPIIVTIISGLIVPSSIPLVGFLMFGNLIRESNVLNNLADSAQNELSNIVTLLLGLTISFNMKADLLLRIDTLIVLSLGLLAFALNICFGILSVKIINIFMLKKINPLVGAAGISAFPIAARISQKMALEKDPSNIILMQATGANVAGQIASAVIGGMLLKAHGIFIP